MIEHVVFIFIISLLIGGMLWSDRDSRYEKEWCCECGAVVWSERYESFRNSHGEPSLHIKQIMEMFTKNMDMPNAFSSTFFGKSPFDNNGKEIKIDIIQGNNEALDSFMYSIQGSDILKERQPLDPSHPIFHGKTAALKKSSRDALNQGYIITHRKSLTESEEK